MTPGDFPPLASTQREPRPKRAVCLQSQRRRSQIAQAFFERYGPEDVRAESGGTEPAYEIWPPVIEAMREPAIVAEADA
jgi:protein-tyrosine-phosphatase